VSFQPFHFCITASNSLLLRPAIHIIASESKEIAHVGMRKRGLIGRPIRPFHNAGSSRFVVIGEKLPILGQLLGGHPFLDWCRWRVRRHRKREKQCNKLMLGSLNTELKARAARFGNVLATETKTASSASP
jgi:hypothetical protein